jgi:hypothetical protein
MSAGFIQRHSPIFSDVSLAPQRPPFASGRLANGHSFVSRGLIFLNNSDRDAGVNPFSCARRVHQLAFFVVADHQSVEILGRGRVPANHKLLTLAYSQLLPGARPRAWLIFAVPALCDWIRSRRLAVNSDEYRIGSLSLGRTWLSSNPRRFMSGSSITFLPLKKRRSKT